jgi:cysteinyl-tRNA synthetase
MIKCALKIYNTLTRSVEEFKPLNPGQVGFYSCGPTVYSFAHIGNFRFYVFNDVFRRTMELMGYKVKQVMNITDVDDKTISSSRKAGLELSAFTKKYTEEFFHDLKVLNIEPADHYPAATEHIAEMTDLVGKLKAKGLTYESGGSVYYSIKKFENYGKLSGMKLSQNVDGARVDSDEYEKDNVKDFVLWKARKEGEPFWETEFGPGRPGWHLECSAMSMKYLGETFDIHSGANDLIFPHHENEIAQSEGATGKPFVRYWVHCAHLIVDGEKMSKSKGNFFTLRDLLEKQANPRAIRWLLLATHYRKNLNFTFEGLRMAQTGVEKFQNFYDELRAAKADGNDDQGFKAKASELTEKFICSLADDLNVSAALSVVFELMNEYNKLFYGRQVPPDARDAALAACETFDRVLAVLEKGKEADVPDTEIQALIDERTMARKNKDWKRSDEIRDLLKSKGILIEDKKDGIKWRRTGE